MSLTLLTSSCFALNPEKEYPYSPEQFGITNYKSFKIKTDDGYQLASWHFSPIQNDQQTLIIIAYGDAGNMSYSLYYVKQLLESGYAVLTFDYRGFGKSDSFPIKKEYLYCSEFAEDLKSVITFAQSNYKNKKTGLMAFSMGTIVTTFALQDVKVDFMIAENYVSDPQLVVERIQQNISKKVLLPEKKNNYTAFLENINCPMLLFSGTKDQTTLLSDSEAMNAKRKNCTVQAYTGDHGQGLTSMTEQKTGDLYFRSVNQFIRNLP